MGIRTQKACYYLGALVAEGGMPYLTRQCWRRRMASRLDRRGPP